MPACGHRKAHLQIKGNLIIAHKSLNDIRKPLCRLGWNAESGRAAPTMDQNRLLLRQSYLQYLWLGSLRLASVSYFTYLPPE